MNHSHHATLEVPRLTRYDRAGAELHGGLGQMILSVVGHGKGSYNVSSSS